MIPIVSYLYNPSWSYGPMILFLLFTMIVGFYVLRGPLYRTLIGYTAFTTAVAGFIYNLLVMISYMDDKAIGSPILISTNRAFFLFYGVYMAFAFMPSYIAFGRISKQRGSTFGTLVVHFTYIWALVLIAIGLALTIITATKLPPIASVIAHDSSTENVQTAVKELIKYNDLLLLLYYSNWGFVAASLVLHVIHFRHLQGTASKTLIAFTTLNVLSVIFFVIFFHMPEGVSYIRTLTAIFWCFFFLVDLPVAAAILIAISYGHLWKLQSLDDKVEVYSQSNDVKKSATVAPAPQNNGK